MVDDLKSTLLRTPVSANTSVALSAKTGSVGEVLLVTTS